MSLQKVKMGEGQTMTVAKMLSVIDFCLYYVCCGPFVDPLTEFMDP